MLEISLGDDHSVGQSHLRCVAEVEIQSDNQFQGVAGPIPLRCDLLALHLLVPSVKGGAHRTLREVVVLPRGQCDGAEARLTLLGVGRHLDEQRQDDVISWAMLARSVEKTRDSVMQQK